MMNDLSLPNIFEYTDYQIFLSDCYKAKKSKNAFFSWRLFAQKLDIDPGFLLRVSQGKNNFQTRHIDSLAKFLELNEHQVQYLHALIDFSKAKSKIQIKTTYEKIIALQHGLTTVLNQDQLIYFQDYYHAAIRAYLSMNTFSGSYSELGKLLNPEISEAKVRESILLQIRLGLISCDSNNTLKVTNKLISTGSNWTAKIIREYQKKFILLGAEALDRFVPEDRDITCLTLALTESDLIQFQGLCQKFRHDILNLGIESEPADRVFQINIQAFPLSQNTSEQKKMESSK